MPTTRQMMKRIQIRTHPKIMVMIIPTMTQLGMLKPQVRVNQPVLKVTQIVRKFRSLLWLMVSKQAQCKRD